MLKRSFFFILFVLFIIPNTLFAQSVDSFSISANPEYPKQGEFVNISIESFTTDLSRSKIIWKEGNVVVSQEVGLKSKSFKTPQNGSSKTISVEVTTPSGAKITKNYTLAPQSLDILWEAVDSYVPPFYKGKAMPGEQSLVRVVAIPNFTSKGVLVDRTQTVYTWSIDGKKSENFSGFNKSALVFSFNPLKNNAVIKVLASTVNGSSQTQETLVLNPRKTEVIFYEASPLLGTLYEKSFSRGLKLITSEITLVAEPYYFSGSKNLLANVGFTWSVDGKIVSPGIDPTRITLRSPGKSGTADISLSVRHVENTLQTIRTAIRIAYEK